ncbi:hypothetical protein AURDEDRAFT_131359 [Auricularia subglabra TFB-10046 SS5]|uniref:BTB domain-containing protein n=1 Tax=Auricularia subglabra (strain TFB-10046 / SS5) TaxID=717982 RepID=J0LC66_AURST|nr:hypothetical protein AURDEDRAFT_131359 [Auricularia subglabra TFB-10046 SS5]
MSKIRPSLDAMSDTGLLLTDCGDLQCPRGNQSIQFQVANKVYQISKHRLRFRSSFIDSLFALPQSDVVGNKAPIVIDVREPEWDAFLWYIHADPLDAEIFSDSPASTEKCARYLGLAIVAHLLDAVDIAQWAMDNALKLLSHPGRTFHVNVVLARLLIYVASCWHGGVHGAVPERCRRLVCEALHPSQPGELSDDPIRVLEVARGDEFVLPHVYSSILRKGPHYNWKDDVRVESGDRARLLCDTHSRLGSQNPWVTSTSPSSALSLPTSESVPRTASGHTALLFGPTVAAQPTDAVVSSQPGVVGPQEPNSTPRWHSEIN